MTVNAQELRAQYGAKLAEAKALLAEGKATEATAAMGRADELKAMLDLSQRMEAGDAYMTEPTQVKAAAAAWREAAPEEGEPEVDRKAWREFKMTSPYGEERAFRYNVPLAVQAKGYAPAFESYLRKGMADMGPQDRKTLSVGIDTAGGFLVPEDLQTEMIRKIAAATIMRGMCRVIQTSRDIATWPYVNYSTDDIYTSGVRLTWTGETPAAATTHRVTDPVFGQVSIPVHTAMASLPLTNMLIEDAAFDVAGIASDLIGEAFALGEDNVFINGTGTAQPMGLLAQAEADGPSAVHLGDTAVPTQAGLLNLEAALPSQYERGAVFLARKATYSVLRAAAQTTSGQVLWGSSMVGGYLQPQPPSLLGYPALRSEFVPAIASAAYSLILGQFSGYTIVDRVGLSIQRLSEIYAETDITLLLARRRVGGFCTEPWRFKLGQMSA